MPERFCPCGGGRSLDACCGPYLDGALAAPNAEALTRARFTALCLGRYDYVLETTHPDFRDDLSLEGIQANLAGVRWLRLDLRETGSAGPSPEESDLFETATFTVLFEHEGETRQMTECAYFRRDDERLYFVESAAQRPLGFRRPSPKVRRNAPCPCGSGIKYKRCCGSASFMED